MVAIASSYIAADAITGAKIADNAINSEHYTDGSIDNAHIADDAIDSEHYAAGSIDTAHIADAQVTLAKQANLAADKIVGRANGAGTGVPTALTAAQVRTVINVEDGSTADQTKSDIDGLAITTVGTVDTGVWNATKILSPKTTHVLNYPFRGLCTGIASGNFQYSEDMLDAQFPFQLNTDYGNTVIANGDLPDVSTYFRSSGVVMPRAYTAIDMVGWASCPGTGEVTISLCKITPTRNDLNTDPTPVVVATTTFTALNSNDRLENFFVGNTADDGQVTIVTAAIAKGDILMPFVISPDTKTAYFNFTLEVEG